LKVLRQRPNSRLDRKSFWFIYLLASLEMTAQNATSFMA
jgi:hypothetical protein